MVIIGNSEPSEKWFDSSYPTVGEVRLNLRMRDSGNLRYAELRQAMKELGPEEGLTITTRVLPEKLHTRLYRRVYYKEDPGAYAVWRYGNRIRLRDNENNSRWTNRAANEDRFNLHNPTENAIYQILNGGKENEAWTGSYIITPLSTPLFRPFVFNIRGSSYAHFLDSKRSEDKFRLQHEEDNYGDRSAVKIPSRTRKAVEVDGNSAMAYKHHTVNLFYLPVEEGSKFANAANVSVDCECDFYKENHVLHRRTKRREELMCAHAVAAAELDRRYRDAV
ncbi:MAG: hypothetical protein QMD85_02480, partial [Candidatus Aenigmarchaeota archaeon]|nr:hypothetical protein [Candidatus Aenigmarchaeota archaeon]MDI6722410.1 hypothetical protein [Candidatus Aenigmarchaeota archaeon]